MADEEVTIHFKADTDDFENGIKTMRGAVEETNDDVSALGALTQSVFGAMEQASTAALNGILLGTQTWQRSVAKIFSNVLASFITTQVVGRTLGWVSAETDMTAATEAGNAARLASDQAAGAVGLGIKASQAASAILNDAKQVYSGVFAFLAPALGPAAVGPALAASGDVAGLAGQVLYAETGAWNIPANSLAYLHAGEMVVPQSFASQMRDGAGGFGGGNHYHITIQAIDTQTGAQFLRDNAGTIVKTLAAQSRGFNPNLKL